MPRWELILESVPSVYDRGGSVFPLFSIQVLQLGINIRGKSGFPRKCRGNAALSAAKWHGSAEGSAPSAVCMEHMRA